MIPGQGMARGARRPNRHQLASAKSSHPHSSERDERRRRTGRNMSRPVEAVSTAVYSAGLSPYRRGNPDPGSRSQRQDRPGLDDLKNVGPSHQGQNWPRHQTRSLRSREHLRMPPSTCGSASGFIPQISRDPWPAPATSGIRLPTTATRRQQPPPAFMPITDERLRPGQAPGRIPQPASQLLQLPSQAGEHVPGGGAI